MKLFNLLLTNVLLLSAVVAIPAQAGTVFNLVPSSNPTGLGDFTVDLTVTTDGMYAFQGDLSFTPGIVEVNDFVGDGDYADLFGVGLIDQPSGLAPDVFGSQDGSGLTIGTDIVVGHFLVTALDFGSASLSFTPAYVVTDPDSFALDSDVSSNSVSLDVVAPEPGSFSLLVLAASGLLLAHVLHNRRNAGESPR